MRIELNPVVLVDSREQAPLVIRRYPVERLCLPVGDYGIRGFSDWHNPQFIIERKSLDDLAGSLFQGRDRFMAEIAKMRQFQFRALVIEGFKDQVIEGAFRSRGNPSSILETLAALEVRTNLHIAWAGDPSGAAAQVESWVKQFCRGLIKSIGPLLPAGISFDVADMDKPKPKRGVEITFGDGSTFEDVRAEAVALA